MKSPSVLLLLTIVAVGLLAASTPNSTIQLSIPTIGTVGIVVGQTGGTPAPAEPAPNAHSPANPGLDSNSALFLYVLLAAIGIIVIGTAFALFLSQSKE